MLRIVWTDRIREVSRGMPFGWGSPGELSLPGSNDPEERAVIPLSIPPPPLRRLEELARSEAEPEPVIGLVCIGHLRVSFEGRDNTT